MTLQKQEQTVQTKWQQMQESLWIFQFILHEGKCLDMQYNLTQNVPLIVIKDKEIACYTPVKKR